MPFYFELKRNNEDDQRTAHRLLALKEGIRASGIPERTVESTLLLATWNIREFDSTKYGERGRESLLYIAEVINSFDVVAVQEVNEDLRALDKLLGYLGGWWKHLITDVTKGVRGNRERIAFLYDSRKIGFGGLAGEIVLPPSGKTSTAQFARTPFLVGFRAGWFKFTICSAHIYYGDGAEDPDRVRELQELSKFLKEQATSKHAWARNMILLGDFNVFQTEDATMRAILGNGFQVSKKLLGTPSNVLRTKHFDQIAFMTPDVHDQLNESRAGVFNFLEYVYKDEDEETYAKSMGKAYEEKPTAQKKTRYYKDWRTFQMSDHLPMWIELKTDFGRQYLQNKISRAGEQDLAESLLMRNIL
ncbi:MAG: endonuclease/exonuclease/phosphatase [Actinobacteria bacterium]|nr:endonuclease/exonuclease/phosphatase [Actinomycetota bacterium]